MLNPSGLSMTWVHSVPILYPNDLRGAFKQGLSQEGAETGVLRWTNEG
jgi:hypothetical protein